ncbi:MAG: hypothetical protein SGARI_002046 [Bacillariaceae sp.]
MTKREIRQAQESVVASIRTADAVSSSELEKDHEEEQHEEERGLHVETIPPKSLVVIWMLMAAELGFDLVTTIIAFAATIGDQDCCGHTIYLGPLPLTTTIPFFLLILTELSFLGRAILLTLWPSVFGNGSDESDSESTLDEEGFEVKLSNEEDGSCDTRGNDSEASETQVGSTVKISVSHEPNDQVQVVGDSNDRIVNTTGKGKKEKKACSFQRVLCCCLRWNAKLTLHALNLLTLLNPFFGCLIAWMLLYKSDKTEAFIVLGLEGFSIILHFVAVRLEGGLRTWCSRLIHSITLLPFLISVVLMLVYLREGGVCYVVESQLFLFSGCEVCPDTLQPPVNGMCGNVTLAGTGGVVDDFENLSWNNLGSLAERGAYQDEYCSEKVNFCFYSF